MRDDQAGTSEPRQSKTEHSVYGEHDFVLRAADFCLDKSRGTAIMMPYLI